MADEEQLAALGGGLQSWNLWRRANAARPVDLRHADLRGFDLSLVPSLRDAEGQGLVPSGSSWSFIANEIIGHDVAPLDLSSADLRGAKLDGMDLRCADLAGADLSRASLCGTDIERGNLTGVRLVDADLTGARLHAADLSGSSLIRTRLDNADLGYARVYGIAVWDVAGTPRDQTSLIVTPPGETLLSTDSLALAQFLYFLIRNANAREVIDTITTKVVLVLGNFGERYKPVLDGMRDRLRGLGLIPVVFDFAVPASKDTTGTVETLARLSRFVVADLTAPSSIPHELATTVPFLRTTPVLLLRQTGATGYSMVRDLQAYPWVLPVHEYESEESLLAQVGDVIRPAVALADRLQGRAV